MAERIARRERTTPTPDVNAIESSVMVYVEQFGEQKEERRALKIHKFVTEPAYVRANAGVTKQTAPYEALRIDVAITFPCYKEEIDETVKHVTQRVAEILQEEMTAYGVGG